MTNLFESDVYDIEERTYVRKAEVDEEVKESRLQGLKDRLAATDGEEAEALRSEIEELEAVSTNLRAFGLGLRCSEPNDTESLVVIEEGGSGVHLDTARESRPSRE